MNDFPKESVFAPFFFKPSSLFDLMTNVSTLQIVYFSYRNRHKNFKIFLNLYIYMDISHVFLKKNHIDLFKFVQRSPL